MQGGPRISVVIVAYNSGDKLLRCVQSVQEHNGAVSDIVVVNNGGRGPELDALEGRKDVTIVEPGENLGFAAGCNLGARQTTGETLVFLNPDTVVSPGALSSLATALDDDTIGIAMGRLRLLDDPDRLNSSGARIHVTGLAWSGGYGEPAESLHGLTEITYANGSVLAIRRELFDELDGFTDELFIYHEDLELGWKARLRGLRIVLDAGADVFHDYDYARNPAKNYFMERNRLIFVLSAYSGRLLTLLAPLLVGAELAVTLAAAREGWLRDKVAGWLWCLEHAGWIRRHRRRLQALRRVPDRELAEHLTPVFDPAMIPVPALVRALNPLVSGYWRSVRRLL